jgi:hypothetical protein
MPTAPNLLNDDQTASIATCLMMSHHGFRRDLARFEVALEKVAQSDGSRVDALRDEWKNLSMTLHGHHLSEDTGLFPGVIAEHASVRVVTDQLSADHRRIDPLLERGEAAFANLRDSTEALAIVTELRALLDQHLAIEEREIIPFLRGMKGFPAPPNEEMLAMTAQGFAWAMQGIAADVLEQVERILPEALVGRLPAARAAFDARCERVWGSSKSGDARTPIPNG